MTSTKPTTKPFTLVEIHIVRDHNYFFYNRSENGHFTIFSQRISADNAAQLMEKFSDHVIDQTGEPRFDNGPYQFTWKARLWQSNDGRLSPA